MTTRPRAAVIGDYLRIARSTADWVKSKTGRGMFLDEALLVPALRREGRGWLANAELP